MRLMIILIHIVLFAVSSAQGQARSQLLKNESNGFIFKAGGFRNLFYLPADTLSTTDSGAIAYRNGKLYFKDANFWKGLIGSSDIPAYSDSTFRKSGTDSIFNSFTGIPRFAFKLPTGYTQPDTITVKGIRAVSPNHINFITNNLLRARIDNNGIFFINTTSSMGTLYKLQVSGWAYVSGAMQAGSFSGDAFGLGPGIFTSGGGQNQLLVNQGMAGFYRIWYPSGSEKRNIIRFSDDAYPDTDMLIGSQITETTWATPSKESIIKINPDGISIKGYGGIPFNVIGTFTPFGSSDPVGATGSISFDSNYLYYKSGAGWKRTILTSF